MRRGPNQRRRARTSVLAGLAVFALSQVMLALAAETVWPEIRDPNFGARWRQLQMRVAEAPARPIAIVFGSSRVETGLQPDAMGLRDDDPAVFNFGLTGAAPNRAWLAFRRMRDAGIRPAAVIIELMPALFSECWSMDHAVRPEKLAAADLADVSLYLHRPDSLWRQWLMARVAPAYSARFVILSLVAPHWLPISSRTDYLWTGLDRFGAARLPDSQAAPAARLAGSQRARDEYAHRLKSFAPPPAAMGLLHRWCDECRESGIPVAILLMPESPEFQTLYSPVARANLDGFLHRLRADMNIPVIDARDWLPASAMFDGHHLLPAGATALSARLGNELRRIGFLPAGKRIAASSENCTAD